MELTKITIDDTTYEVEKVEPTNIITGQRYVFFGNDWYHVLYFNLYNHIKK